MVSARRLTLFVMSKHHINKTIIVSTLAMLVPLVVSAQDISDWRAPTQSELSDKLGWRKGNPNLYVTAKADFDGDGQEDVARLLINDKKNKTGLLVTLSSQKKAEPLLLEAIDDKRIIEVMGIDVAKPGTYKTACGKGYWTCKKGEPSELKLTNPAIDFFRFESANSYFVWDTKTKKFKRIWMSD
jgi:hypothetical protein